MPLSHTASTHTGLFQRKAVLCTTSIPRGLSINSDSAAKAKASGYFDAEGSTRTNSVLIQLFLGSSSSEGQSYVGTDFLHYQMQKLRRIKPTVISEVHSSYPPFWETRYIIIYYT